MSKTLESSPLIPPPTVFLDRDGVLNEKMPEGRYVTRWNEFHVLPGVIAAIRRLNQSGIRVIVVSNQRGIALGLYSAEDVTAIHNQFQSVLQAQGAHVDAFYFCPHDKGHCACRKPLPGMFEEAKADFPSLSASDSVMIGDSKSDIEFGEKLGMATAFIAGHPDLQKPGTEEAIKLADFKYSSLSEAVDDLLARMQKRSA